MENNLVFWIVFIVLISIMFYIDLYITDHRKGKIGVKASLIWSGIWIGVALLFNLSLYIFLENGSVKSLEFLTGYLIEKSLSVDNLFVFLMIFNIMNVKDEYQPHILKWGILSAIVLRIIFILAGVALIQLFHPIIYLFGAILIFAAYKMAFGDDKPIDFKSNPLLKFATSHFKLNPNYEGKKFFISINDVRYITPMFLAFLMIESADVVFAVDSIPAVIAITHDPFIVITSNIFAILGLRALYFALANIVDLFIYLKYGVAVILFYVGIKMLISDIYKIPTAFSLVFIVLCLVAAIGLSLMRTKNNNLKSDINL